MPCSGSFSAGPSPAGSRDCSVPQLLGTPPSQRFAGCRLRPPSPPAPLHLSFFLFPPPGLSPLSLARRRCFLLSPGPLRYSAAPRDPSQGFSFGDACQKAGSCQGGEEREHGRQPPPSRPHPPLSRHPAASLALRGGDGGAALLPAEVWTGDKGEERSGARLWGPRHAACPVHCWTEKLRAAEQGTARAWSHPECWEPWAQPSWGLLVEVAGLQPCPLWGSRLQLVGPSGAWLVPVPPPRVPRP